MVMKVSTLSIVVPNLLRENHDLSQVKVEPGRGRLSLRYCHFEKDEPAGSIQTNGVTAAGVAPCSTIPQSGKAFEIRRAVKACIRDRLGAYPRVMA
jgi:hypothetical protein